jgi:putative ABC transport system permease protein
MVFKCQALVISMRPVETVKISLSELRSNKLRTFLTMLGIVFGVASVIAMLSIGEGARQETIEQIELLGSNNIIVKEREPAVNRDTDAQSFSPGLSIKDAVSIKEINPFVKSITPQREASMLVTYKAKIFDATIIGTTPNYTETFNSKLHSGLFFSEEHNNGFSNVCVIGWGIKNKFFKFDNPINKKIKIDDLWFTVIGVMDAKVNISSTGSGMGIRNFNEDIYIPFNTMMHKMEKYDPDAEEIGWWQRNRFGLSIDRSSVNQLTIKVTSDEIITEAGDLIARILKRKHYGVKDYDIIIPEQLLAQKQKTQRIFNIVMGAIAGISLLVGGIGIMNIMLANILERTREIGIRRAVGATGKNILNQFMYEAVTISVVGGIIGIVIGFILTSLITTYADWRTIISPIAIILAFFVSVIIGLIFGIYPAKKAATKDPIESLRYE